MERNSGRHIAWKQLLVAVMVVAVGAFGVWQGAGLLDQWRTPPERLVGEAFLYAAEAPSYQYDSVASRLSGGKETIISRIHGEKHGENTHLTGTVDVVDSALEVYQIGDVYYRRDAVTQQWLAMEGQQQEATVRLMQEVNPLSCLLYDTASQITELEGETVNDTRCRKIQLRSNGENTFLTAAWREFYYTLWIDRQHRLQQVEMIAEDHHADSDQLRLQVVFDWKSPVEEIAPPV